MITYPSYVTFGLKMGLLVIECMKYKFSYDLSVFYNKLKDSYKQADSSALP